MVDHPLRPTHLHLHLLPLDLRWCLGVGTVVAALAAGARNWRSARPHSWAVGNHGYHRRFCARRWWVVVVAKAVALWVADTKGRGSRRRHSRVASDRHPPRGQDVGGSAGDCPPAGMTVRCRPGRLEPAAPVDIELWKAGWAYSDSSAGYTDPGSLLPALWAAECSGKPDVIPGERKTACPMPPAVPESWELRVCSSVPNSWGDSD